ncbi:MAG: beta-hydroxyacyl-ACP dehydratase [Bacteriovoracaceae bacterium]|nr:beta-hydroxyacyl-ACP dehydratase [Bacteriovoracaceae bacterium]
MESSNKHFPHPSKLIPQAHPFLFVDEILDASENSLHGVYTWREDEYFLKGHFPGNPVVPGVILCEMLLQCGALWMSLQQGKDGKEVKEGKEGKLGIKNGTPVVTRMSEAKFKQIVRPGDKSEGHVQLLEKMGDVAFLRGKILVQQKVAITLEFAVALIDRDAGNSL